jgi:hypothetical protein
MVYVGSVNSWFLGMRNLNRVKCLNFVTIDDFLIHSFIHKSLKTTFLQSEVV